MRYLVFVVAMLLVGSVPASAERASVGAAKAAVKAVTVAAKAVPKTPIATWRALKWVARHA